MKSRKPKKVIATKLGEEELVPVTIGLLEEKGSNTIVMIVGISLIFLFALGLPYINNFIVTWKEGTPTQEPQKTTPSQTVPEDDSRPVNYVTYKDGMTYTMEQYVVADSFSKEEDEFTFIIHNSGPTTFDMMKERYFIEFYTADQMLLGRQILPEVYIAKDQVYKVTFSIEEDILERMQIIAMVKKSESDYPNVVLTEDTDRTKKLSCKKEEQSLVYTFNTEEKLQSIQETYIFSSSDASLIGEYQSYSANLKKIPGIESTFSNSITGFSVISEIDLQEANISSLKQSYFYPKDTLPKVIQFELEADGYTCN